VSQEAFARAARSLGTLEDPERLGGWFYKILVRLAQNHRRWSRVRERFWAPFRDTPADAACGDPGLRDRISRALAGLTDAQRESFVLVHREGFTVQETADLTGRAPGTVKSHLHRALVHLRLELADLDPREDR
jgi:RNA polymerase sigma-70 factor (ECF subfamily)